MSRRWKNPGRWVWACPGAAMALFAVLALGSAPPATMPSVQIQQLVKELQSDQFSVRTAAQRKLEELGPGAVKELQSALALPLSEEARTRIGAATRRIADEQRFGPSLITLHCKDELLAPVLHDFAQQAGADLGIDRAEIQAFSHSHKISLDLENADFWTALEAIESASGLHAHGDQTGKLILDTNAGFWMGQRRNPALSRVAGPCLVVPQSANWSVSYMAGAAQSSLNVQLQVLVEPKLRITGGNQENWVKDCVDDRGNSLVNPANPSFWGGFFYGGAQPGGFNLSANLRPPPHMGSKIARLKGQLRLDVETKSQMLEVNQVLSSPSVTWRLPQGSITFEKMDNEAGRFDLHLSIDGPMALPNSPMTRNLMSQQVQVTDADDQPLQPMGGSQNYSQAGRASLILYFSPGNFMRGGAMALTGPPAKMRCEIATETRPINVPFELDDIPLFPTN